MANHKNKTRQNIKKQNVLILCLSKINDGARKRKYLYRTENYIKGTQSEYRSLEGYMTNEPTAKYVLEQLKENNQRLDKVLMICTKDVTSVYNPGADHALLKDAEVLAILNREGPMNRPSTAGNFNRTPAEYYQAVVNARAKELNKGDYTSRPIEYIQIPSPNVMSTEELSKAVVEAADMITAGDVETDLYIDFNGGPRDVAFMIYSLANLMKLRNVTVRQILTMNYENPEPKMVQGVKTKGIQIEVRNAVFESVDLIAGINEYVKYGRIQGLRAYFDTGHPSGISGTSMAGGPASGPEGNGADSSKGTERQRLLDQMEEFAGNLQLCRTGYIMSHKADLDKALTDYAGQGGQAANATENYGTASSADLTTTESGGTESGTVQDQLFGYVIKDIQRGYHGLLDGDLPDIIDWCIRHDYIQQAVTFCSEQLPWYFWNEGICAPTAAEAQEYWAIRKAMETFANNPAAKPLKKGYRSGVPGVATGELSSEYARYAYEWLINYLPQSRTQNYTSFIDSLPQGQIGNLPLRSVGLTSWQAKNNRNSMILNYMSSGSGGTILIENTATSDRKILKLLKRVSSHGTSSVQETHTIKVSTAQMDEAAKNAAAIFHQRQNGRVQTGFGNQTFREILLLYFLIKAQRNELNHADGSREGWHYQELREAVLHMARLLQ